MYFSLLCLFVVSIENTSQYYKYKLTNCSDTYQKVPLNLIGLFPCSKAVGSSVVKHCDILSYGAVRLLSKQLAVYFPDLFGCFDVKLHAFTTSVQEYFKVITVMLLQRTCIIYT